MNQNELKKSVGKKSVEFIKDNMIIGLGTGTTVKYMIDALGEKIKKENIKIIGVTTSKRTEQQAKKCGIKLKSVDEVDHIDLTIDGADEISSDFQGIKGGGASLLFEKIVAINSDKVMWIVDESKLSNKLGSFPLPVEVIPYGSHKIFKKFINKGLNPSFRMINNQFLTTDSNNYIIDLHINEIENPRSLAEYLINQVGVVEQGLFLDMVNTIIVGHENGPEIINVNR